MNSDEIASQILGDNPGIGSIYKALKILKEAVDGTEDEMRKRAPNVEIAQVNALVDINSSLMKLNRSIEWLTAAVICSCADDPRKTLVATNKMVQNPALGDGGFKIH